MRDVSLPAVIFFDIFFVPLTLTRLLNRGESYQTGGRVVEQGAGLWNRGRVVKQGAGMEILNRDGNDCCC